MNCSKNKANRTKVKFQQMTGSRSYIAHCEDLVISCCFTLFDVPYYQIYIDCSKCRGKPARTKKYLNQMLWKSQGLSHQQEEGHDYTSQSRCCKSLILMPFNYYLLWLVPWTAWFASNVYYSFKPCKVQWYAKTIVYKIEKSNRHWLQTMQFNAQVRVSSS